MKKEKHYIDFIEKNCSDWMDLKVLTFKSKDSILLEDNEGYRYTTSVSIIRNAKSRSSKLSKYFRNNPNTLHNIENCLKINNVHYHLVDSSIKNAKERVQWSCDSHGIFYSSLNTIQSNGSGCPKCGRESAKGKRRNSYDYVNNTFKEKGLLLQSIKYKNNIQNLKYICKKHQFEGVQVTTFGNLITKNCVCTYCNKERFRDIYTKTQSEFEKEVNTIHNDSIKVIGEYLGSNQKIKLECIKCGHKWYTKASHTTSGHGCPNCQRKSKGEDMIRELLNKYKINFI